jgi:citrate synthase
MGSGLDGVVAATTRLSAVDGARGKLTIAGFPVEVIAPRARFEDVLFLLWEDRLPLAEERAQLARALGAARRLSPEQLALIDRVVSAGSAPMDALRFLAGTIDLDGSAVGDRAQAIRLVGGIGALVATLGARRAGRSARTADPAAWHAADLLAMLEGAPPSAARARALDTWLVTVSDHGLNASTFAARVVISTGSGLTDAVVAAIGALKGPLHGGAPGPALALVREIGAIERAPAAIAAKLAAGERLMGFGHRIYRTRDPRAEVLDAACRALHAAGEGDPALFALARGVEDEACRQLALHRPARALRTNVEFYTALLLDSLRIPTELFTPLFAAGRAAGWTAHALEQQAEGRLIRPSSEYIGAHDRQWP